MSAWILDNQLARRNINAITRNDLIGRRYTVQKRISSGRPEGSKECHQNDDINFPKQTRFKIADQVPPGKLVLNHPYANSAGARTRKRGLTLSGGGI